MDQSYKHNTISMYWTELRIYLESVLIGGCQILPCMQVVNSQEPALPIISNRFYLQKKFEQTALCYT